MSTKIESYLINQVTEDIEEFLVERSATTPVEKGNLFLEWCLANVFQLREDEIEVAISIGGKSDNGLDAVFESNNELFIIQGKYGKAHNIDAIHRFINDCIRLLENTPDTAREAVIEAAFKIREAFSNGININCYYITNNELLDWEKSQAKKALDGKKFTHVSFNIFDIESMVERIQLNRGELPEEFKKKWFKIKHTTACRHDSTKGETYIAVVSLKEFADFIRQDKESDLIFYSNIRNYLNSTSINSGIRKTIETDPKSFWYYNNGITVVCDELEDHTYELRVKSPQIVNGCQTAKNIYAAYKRVSNQSAQDILNDGHILVRFIHMRKSMTDADKKRFRDDVTRFTNSQNAVKGLDFYSLDQFQRELQYQFDKLSYYYEIQRGAYATEKNRRNKKNQFKGQPAYNYLINDYSSTKKYVLPAKEVIQSFTAGIKLMPNIAYGRANELTPTGKRWEDIMNEDTKSFKVEAFLFPYLVWMYAKHTLSFTRGSAGESYKRNSAFLFVATYFLLVLKIINKINGTDKEELSPDDIIKIKQLFSDETLNKFLLKVANNTLKAFFRDSQVHDAIGDNMRGFIQNQLSRHSKYWDILNRFLDFEINDNIVPEDEWQQLKTIFS